MAYKMARTRALADVWRLITAHDETGNTWYLPDAHFMTTYPIFDGYKQKKSQVTMDLEHSVQPIIDQVNSASYTAGKYADKTVTDHTGTVCKVIDGENGEIYEWVNKAYADLLDALYPDAQIMIDDEKAAQPVVYKQNDQVVAILMPLKTRQ